MCHKKAGYSYKFNNLNPLQILFYPITTYHIVSLPYMYMLFKHFINFVVIFLDNYRHMYLSYIFMFVCLPQTCAMQWWGGVSVLNEKTRSNIAASQ